MAEKRTYIRITYPSIALGEVADLEEKLEDLLQKYGVYEIEITAMSSPAPPLVAEPEDVE